MQNGFFNNFKEQLSSISGEVDKTPLFIIQSSIVSYLIERGFGGAEEERYFPVLMASTMDIDVQSSDYIEGIIDCLKSAIDILLIENVCKMIEPCSDFDPENFRVPEQWLTDKVKPIILEYCKKLSIKSE